MAIREHLPQAKEIVSWPAVKVMRLGHGAIDAAHRLKESHEVAQLDFSGSHALQPGKDQKTIYETGISPSVFPIHRKPKHELTDPKRELTVTEVEDRVTPGKNNPNYLYTHSDYMASKPNKTPR